VLICSSFINPKEYPDNTNLLQTGIAEATKAGVKVLGVRFGKSLNARTVFKKRNLKAAVKRNPDNKVLQAYHAAKSKDDFDTINRIEEMYNIKQETNVA
jgi:peroxiredoxin